VDQHERDEDNERRSQKLIAMVRGHLPIDVRVSGPADAWQLVGPALLARQVGSLEALFAQRPLDRQADGFVLLRTLYEHAVTFAWFAADPGADRHSRFLKSDAVARLEADEDIARLGISMLTTEERAKFEAQRDGLPKQMPDLSQRAEAADSHWAGKLEYLKESSSTHSYRGLYATAYRHHSAIAHPSLMGLNFVTVDLPDGMVRVRLEERDPDMNGPFGLGVILFAFSLYISGQTLGWPEADEIDAAFD
jgi:hypothetical protein